jgi:hypothetical protein
MTRARIPQGLLAYLASEHNSTIFPSEVCSWVAGRPLSAEKGTRLLRVLIDVENLLSERGIRPDLTDYANVAVALMHRRMEVPVVEARKSLPQPSPEALTAVLGTELKREAVQQ